MARQACVEGGMPVGFGGAVFEGAGKRGEEKMGSIDECFGALR